MTDDTLFSTKLRIWFACVCIVFTVLLVTGFALWACFWLLFHTSLLLVLLTPSDSKILLHMLSWVVPNSHVVRTMDFDGEVCYALAHGEWGDIMHAHKYWLFDIGPMQLHPNGHVSGLSYVSFWEPLCPAQRTIMYLVYDRVHWPELQQMTAGEKVKYRDLLANQVKMSHDTNI